MIKKKVTLQNIADHLGISLKAASLGINGGGRLSAKTRQRIQDAAREMSYMPNVAARSLVTKQSLLIGVLVPYFSDSFFRDIIAGIEEIANESNFTLLLGNLTDDPDEQYKVIRRLTERGVDGFIVYPFPSLRDLTGELTRFRVPIVQVMSCLTELGTASVIIDNYKAGATVARHFLDCGHKNIGIIHHNHVSREMKGRYDGFSETLKGGLICMQSEMNKESGYETARQMISAHPEVTAIFCTTDFAALGAVKAALELGKKIPEELAIAGFDDLEITSQQVVYPLTTIAQPKEQIGREAGQMLLNILKGKEGNEKILEAPLVIRTTTVKGAFQ